MTGAAMPVPADPAALLRGPVPRVAVATLLIAAVLGVVQGAIWARVAPLPPYLVYADGTFAGLPTVSSQLFIGIAIYTLMGLVIGIVLAAGVWRIRRVRGTVTLLSLTFAAAVGAWLAYVVGNAMSSGVDPASIGATAAASIVSTLPGHTALAIVVEPALAAAVYTFLAAWNGSPQLGRWPGRTVADPVPDTRMPAAEVASGSTVAARVTVDPPTAPVPLASPPTGAGPQQPPRVEPPTGPLTPPGT